jgi:hypothetical protein
VNCPSCGAWAYEDNLGRWFCSQSCGWNSGYTMGERNELSVMRRGYPAERHRGVVVRELRLAVRSHACPDPVKGSLRA